MDTEPVRTTIKGIENTVTGAAVQVTATAALVQAGLLFASQVIMWLSPGSTGIPIEIQQSAVALITVAMTWWVTIRGKASIRESGVELREQVTPWDQETGARTPGPIGYVVDPVDPMPG